MKSSQSANFPKENPQKKRKPRDPQKSSPPVFALNYCEPTLADAISHKNSSHQLTQTFPAIINLPKIAINPTF